MASWSSRRKLRYALGVTFVLVVFIAVPVFLLVYKAPTCFDLRQNGKETGIDCGGSCARLCQSAFLPPSIKWGGAKLEKLADGLYNISAYLVNPNINGAAKDVPYRMSLYDAAGVLIVEKDGKVNLNPYRNSLAFQTAVNVEKRVPTKATFEFTKAPMWFKSEDALVNLNIVDRKYEEDGTSSSLEVILENRGLTALENIQVSVILYDISDNVIGFSQTFIDSIAPKGGRESANYTWPINREGKVTSIEVMSSIRSYE